MKLLKSIGHALLASAVVAVVLIGIVTAACIALASIWLVCEITGVPFWIIILGIFALSLVIGFVLEAIDHV